VPRVLHVGIRLQRMVSFTLLPLYSRKKKEFSFRWPDLRAGICAVEKGEEIH